MKWPVPALQRNWNNYEVWTKTKTFIQCSVWKIFSKTNQTCDRIRIEISDLFQQLRNKSNGDYYWMRDTIRYPQFKKVILKKKSCSNLWLSLVKIYAHCKFPTKNYIAITTQSTQNVKGYFIYRFDKIWGCNR